MNETRADFLKNVLPVIFPEFAAGSQERRACQDGLRRVWEMFGSGAAVFNYRAVDWVGLRVDEARRDGKPLNAYLDRDLEVMRRMTAHSTPNARIVPLNRWVFDGIINYPGPIFGLKTKEGIAAILALNCTSHGFVMEFVQGVKAGGNLRKAAPEIKMPPRDYLMDCLVSASAGFLGSGSKFTLYKHLRPEGSPRRDFYRNLRKRYFGSKPAQVHTVDRMDPIEAYRLKPTKPRVKALARKARAAAGLPKPVKPGRARHPKFRPRG